MTEPIYVFGTSVMHILRAQWHSFTNSATGVTWAEGSTFCGLRAEKGLLWRVIPNELALMPPVVLCKTCAKASGEE